MARGGNPPRPVSEDLAATRGSGRPPPRDSELVDRLQRAGGHPCWTSSTRERRFVARAHLLRWNPCDADLSVSVQALPIKAHSSTRHQVTLTTLKQLSQVLSNACEYKVNKCNAEYNASNCAAHERHAYIIRRRSRIPLLAERVWPPMLGGRWEDPRPPFPARYLQKQLTYPSWIAYPLVGSGGFTAASIMFAGHVRQLIRIPFR